MMTPNKLRLTCIVIGLLAANAAPARATVTNPTDPFTEFRAMWVTRFDYRNGNENTVRQIVQDAASLGVTDLLFQVRGKSDAYYDSSFEPRAEGLALPNWDPLEIAIDEAHSLGMNLHAYINSMPLWRGTAAPVDNSHPFHNTNPSFRRFDINGIPEDPLNQNGEYASANPILPEVHTHINNVVNDIATNYDVDGVHLDYIRWLGNQNFDTLPHDAQSHQMFFNATGLDAADPANATAYRGYIRDRITDLVASLSNTLHTADPDAKLSAAVWRDPDIAFNDRLQDYETWLEQNYLDIAMPMIYLSDSNNNLLEPNLLNTLAIETDARVAPGLGVFLHDAGGGGTAETLYQLEKLLHLGAKGSTMFAYSSFFASGSLGTQRQAVYNSFFNSLTAPITLGDPAMTQTLVDFEGNEGSFSSSPTFSGSNIGIFSGTADLSTEQAHSGTMSQKIVIDGDPNGWFLRHVSGQGSPGNNTPVDANGWIGLWVLTEDTGMTISLALDDPSSADRGFRQDVIADGQWHLYEWDLNNDFYWEGWVSGDGDITGPTVTMDSIMFFGFGDVTFYIDDVTFNPDGSLQPPMPTVLLGDANNDGQVTGADLIAVQQNFGNVGPADGTLLGDANDDGQVTGADLIAVQQNFGSVLAPGSAQVPEPGVMLLMLASVGAGSLKRPRRARGEA